MRTAQLEVEVENLNCGLRAEHDQLADALEKLKRSQTRLVESERMATLGQLNQVRTNLISNAVGAMQGAGELRVETDVPAPERVRVRVIDYGKGMEPDVLAKAFDLHFTSKGGRVEFGLGMGLPICRQIVTRHGCTIVAESRPGETCFTVVLPVRHPRSSEDEARP